MCADGVLFADWQLFDDTARRHEQTKQRMAESAAGDALPSTVQALVASYLAPPPAPALMRMRLVDSPSASTADKPLIETLGGWRLFYYLGSDDARPDQDTIRAIIKWRHQTGEYKQVVFKKSNFW